MMKTAILPFTIKRTPVEKLLLINFEKDADKLYTALELQYLNGAPYGKGYRIIAYRNDKFIDVYDDSTLTFLEKETFQVTGKGLGDHLTTSIKQAKLTKHEDRFKASFEFLDKLGRVISVQIKEHSKRSTTPLQLLAPVGSSSITPNYFPLFFLDHFDFVRTQNTSISIMIDGCNKTPDPFPFHIPKDYQLRYFTRYALDCHLFEFAPNETTPLLLVDLNEHNQAKVGCMTYSFTRYSNDNHLATISYHDGHTNVSTIFSPALPDFSHLMEQHSYSGDIRIHASPTSGTIVGRYCVKLVDQRISFTIYFSGGWVPHTTTLYSKLMFMKNSIFCTWPKTYEYHQMIDLNQHTCKQRWRRI